MVLNKKKTQIFANNIILNNQGSTFRLHSPLGNININLPLLGLHNISNALAAISIAIALQIPLKCIQIGLSKIPKMSGRLEVIKLKKHVTIINDTYNANVASMIAAIKVLEKMPGHTIFVSGDIAEMGEMSMLYHKIIGNIIRISRINSVMSIGVLSKKISKHSGKGNHFTSFNVLINNLMKKISKYKKVTILVKGSRSEKLEKIVEKLIQEYKNDFSNL
ncbi:MAG: cyanophycin synthetase [Buchnera aphidicola (Nurudea yanoniella)]